MALTETVGHVGLRDVYPRMGRRPEPGEDFEDLLLPSRVESSPIASPVYSRGYEAETSDGMRRSSSETFISSLSSPGSPKRLVAIISNVRASGSVWEVRAGSSLCKVALEPEPCACSLSAFVAVSASLQACTQTASAAVVRRRCLPGRLADHLGEAASLRCRTPPLHRPGGPGASPATRASRCNLSSGPHSNGGATSRRGPFE